MGVNNFLKGYLDRRKRRKATDKLLRKKRLRLSTCVALVFSLASIYFLAHIVHWYFSGESTIDIIETVNIDAVAGVELDNEVASTDGEYEKKIPYVAIDFKELKERNPDTVAWLKMDAVNISMPIVQTIDNDYYLSHDIDRKSNNLGWVFADARTNLDNLGTNGVLYGHNTGNKQMFGSLKDIFKTDPEMYERNSIIQLTTQSNQMVFEIISVYVTTFEDWKYVQHTFHDDESKRLFVNRIKDRNSMPIFARDDVSLHDSFLTFSTCYGPAGTSDRLVIHARMVGQQPSM